MKILDHVVLTSGDVYPIQTGYDSTGRKTRGATTRNGGNTWDETGWTYDPASGLNTAKRYADGSQIAYAYTDNGKKTRTTWARGVWKENAYDSDNRVSGVTYSDGTPTVQYAYNEAGKVAEAATAGGAQFGYAYDERLLCTNEAVRCDGALAVAVVRSFDDKCRSISTVVMITNVAHAVKSRWFDSENRVAGYALTNSLGRGVTATLAYDGSRMSGMTFALPNGGTFSTALTLNAARPDLVTHRAYSANGSPIYSYDTSFDLLSRPVNATDSQSLARSYLYNRRSELAAATIGTNAFEYAYDTIGNRTVASANSVTNTYAANALNQYTQIDALLFAYDNDGNLIQDDRFIYTYDAENRLVSVRPISPTEGALAVVNAYDHKHGRVTKRVERFDGEEWQTSETHTFVYDGCNIVLERIAFADGTTRTVEYFWGSDLSGTEQGAGGVGGLLAVSIDGSFYFPCYDQIGNVVCYVSDSGLIVAQYVYDPYGNVIDQYGALADVFDVRFSTRYTDRETGLVPYKRRFYRPEHGRWLNRDPLEEFGGENLFAFCLNNSIVYVDPFGMDIWVENTVAVGGFHQRVCVDIWRQSRIGSCCKGKTYCKTGKYCISFGADDGADTTDSYSGDGGSFDSDSSGDSSISKDERTRKGGASPFPKGFDGPNDNGDGSVYSDNRDPATKTAYYFDTGDDPCVDMEILAYLKGLIGQRANYSIFGQSCRSFSQAVFNRFAK